LRVCVGGQQGPHLIHNVRPDAPLLEVANAVRHHTLTKLQLGVGVPNGVVVLLEKALSQAQTQAHDATRARTHSSRSTNTDTSVRARSRAAHFRTHSRAARRHTPQRPPNDKTPREAAGMPLARMPLPCGERRAQPRVRARAGTHAVQEQAGCGCKGHRAQQVPGQGSAHDVSTEPVASYEGTQACAAMHRTTAASQWHSKWWRSA
jgi:hypothetical protein